MVRSLIVAAPRSGSGKTTVTLALLAAFRRRGIAVRAAKSGPDYIDPGFHRAATGHPSPNLDSWAMPPLLLDAVAAQARDAALLVIESAMGLFDGIDAPPGRRGSAADLAARFALPVLLVLDVSGQAQSAAAVARGFASHEGAVRVGGVVLNRIGSERHRAMASQAMPVPVLGSVPRGDWALPERHLGLVQAEEHAHLSATLAALADMAEAHLDLDGILDLATEVSFGVGRRGALAPPGQRIALARDAAFSFIYPHLLDGFRAAGAEITFFSPLADEAPPDDADCCWLPGGYPELHAPALAAAGRFRAGLARFAETRPVHGECGGYMALGQALEDSTGAMHAMTGLLGHTTSFARRRMSLGYREATLAAGGALGPAGTVLRGHEFHYSQLTDPGGDPPFATLRDGVGGALPPGGGRRGRVTGSFFHVIAVA